MTDLLVQRDRFRNEAERLRNQHADEVSQIMKELRDAQSSLSEMSNSKGAEVAGLISRFNNEKMTFENSLKVFKIGIIYFKNKTSEIESLWRQLEQAKETARRADLVLFPF